MSRQTQRFWIVTVATVFTMAATAALGLWQLDRAGQKLALQAQIDRRGTLPAWGNADLLGATDVAEGVHRPVRLRGQWVPQASVFLDNRQMNGRVGLYLVTPLRLLGSDRAVLVQRGWVPRDFTDRSRLPTIATPAVTVDVEGRLASSPSKLYDLGGAGSGPIRQNIHLAAFAQETGLNLLGVSVLQSGEAADGLQRDWPHVAVDVHKHHGYAFQWFALCALAGGLYVWFHLVSPRRKRSSHGTDAR